MSERGSGPLTQTKADLQAAPHRVPFSFQAKPQKPRTSRQPRAISINTPIKDAKFRIIVDEFEFLAI